MVKIYLVTVVFVFLIEAILHLNKIITSIYPRRSHLISKNEDKTYFVIYLIFVIYGLFAIFMM